MDVDTLAERIAYIVRVQVQELSNATIDDDEDLAHCALCDRWFASTAELNVVSGIRYLVDSLTTKTRVTRLR